MAVLVAVLRGCGGGVKLLVLVGLLLVTEESDQQHKDMEPMTCFVGFAKFDSRKSEERYHQSIEHHCSNSTLREKIARLLID